MTKDAMYILDQDGVSAGKGVALAILG